MKFTTEQLEKIHHNQAEDRMVLSTDLKKNLGEPPQRELSSGLGKLDDFIDGFIGGELTTISGFSGHGKTLLAQTLTKEFVRQGDCPAWFTFEVRPQQFLQQFGQNLPIFTLPAKHKDKSLDWIEERIVEAQLKYDSKSFFVDHLHFVVDIATQHNMSIEIGMIMRRFKNICIEYNMVGFIIAHLQKMKLVNNKNEKQEPGLGDTRDSSFIEQESDNVLFIWRRKDKENGGQLKIAKNRRNGTMDKIVSVIKRGPYLEVDYEGKEQGKIIEY